MPVPYSSLDIKPLAQAQLGLTAAPLYTAPPNTKTIIKEINIPNRGPIADPTVAPTLTASTTGGNLATGTVYVKFTFVDSNNNETLPSPEASVAVTGPTASVALSGITLPFGAVGIRVYSSSVSGTEKYNAQSAAGSATYTITTIGAGASPLANNATGSASGVTIWLFRVPSGASPSFDNVILKWTLNDKELFKDGYSMVLAPGDSIQGFATGRGCTATLSGVELS